MSDEQLAQPAGKIGFVRYVCATTAGIVTGFMLSMAIAAGVEFNYGDEPRMDNWGIFFWGDHYIIRTIWSLAASAGGALMGGLIARRRGWLIGLLTVVPTILVWFFGVASWVFEYTGDSDIDYGLLSLGNKVVSVLIPLLTVPVAVVFGGMGEAFASECSHHFDARKYSILGIKWYHHFWIWVVLYIYVVQSAWIIDYGLGWWRLVSFGDLGLWDIIPSLFLMAIIMTLGLTFHGITLAYDCLTDYERVYDRGETVKGILLYGFGFPILAMIAQSLIVGIHYGMSYLLS